MHAIGRCAVDIAKAVGCGLYVHRRMQGQRVRFRAVVLLGRHHLDICNGFKRLVQSNDAAGLIAIIVTNQNFHGSILRSRL